MKFLKLTVVFAFTLLSAAQLFSQDKIAAGGGNSILINEKKPAIYLEFVKSGICRNGNYATVISSSPCEGNSEFDKEFKAVWVRLVNNTRWAIVTDIQKMSVPPVVYPIVLSNKQTVTAAKDGAEFDVIYDIESETGCDFHKEAPTGETCARRETPVPDYNRRGVSSRVFVPSGNTIIYAIDQEHLKKYLATYIFYNYEWEISRGGQPSPPRYDSQHRLYFGWFDAETGLKKESEQKIK